MNNTNIPDNIDDIISNKYITKKVFIEGDKNGFNSKIAVDKFKTCIRKMDIDNTKINLDELQKKFIKSNYKLELIKYESTDENIIIKISELIDKTQLTKTKLLKEKLKAMTHDRRKLDYYKVNSDNNITDEILKEYIKLKKISKIPVPEPNEILSNPEQYKPILNMVLNNKLMNQMGVNHPYIRYFKLIADKLNIQPQNSESDNTILTPENILSNISNNKMSKDEDTDEEDE